jgi:hypothetical protein
MTERGPILPRTAASRDAPLDVLVRLPACVVLYVWLYVAEGPTTRWSPKIEQLAEWIMRTPGLARRFFRRASRGDLLGKSARLAKCMHYRSCALTGSISEAEQGFQDDAPTAPASPERDWWQRHATESFTLAGRPDIAARLEYARFLDMVGMGGEQMLLASARLYASALDASTVNHASIAREALTVLRRVRSDPTKLVRVPSWTDDARSQVEDAYWSYLVHAGYWTEVVECFAEVADFSELPEIRRLLWRRAVKAIALGETQDLVAASIFNYFAIMSRSASTTDVERHDWLMSAAVASQRFGFRIRAGVACAHARDLALKCPDMRDSLWSDAEHRSLCDSLSPLPACGNSSMAALADRFQQGSLSKEAEDARDLLLLEPTSDAASPEDAIRRVGEDLMAMGYPAHLTLRELEVASRNWRIEDSIPKLRDWLGDKAEEAKQMENAPDGLHPEDKKRYAVLMSRIEGTKETARVQRDDVEQLIELTMEITPPEERVRRLVQTASLAHGAGYGSIAESCLLGARRSCMNYDDLIARCKMFSVLTGELRMNSLRKLFPLLCESIFRESRNTARNTAVLGSGFTDEERAELKDLARRIDEDWWTRMG